MAICGCGHSSEGQETNYLAAQGVRTNNTGFIRLDQTTNIWTCDAAAWTVFDPDNFQFSVGSGISRGRYVSTSCGQMFSTGDGAVIDIEYMFLFGSGSSFGLSTWAVAMPPDFANRIGEPRFGTSDLLDGHQIVGQWTVWDDSMQEWYKGRVYVTTGTAFPIRMRFVDDIGGTNLSVAQDVPITFAVGDQLSLIVRLEITGT